MRYQLSALLGTGISASATNAKPCTLPAGELIPSIPLRENLVAQIVAIRFDLNIDLFSAAAGPMDWTPVVVEVSAGITLDGGAYDQLQLGSIDLSPSANTPTVPTDGIQANYLMTGSSILTLPIELQARDGFLLTSTVTASGLVEQYQPLEIDLSLTTPPPTTVRLFGSAIDNRSS